jgi:predicted Zn-dependent protease with MMP-like domain
MPDAMAANSQTAPTLAEIETLARAALERLPEPFAAHLRGVILIVEDFAEDAVLDEMGIENPFDLSGLYSGRPIGEPAQTGDPPATIHLYRRPILDEWCESGEALDHLVAHIVVHEVGHHFGLSDADMHALEEAVA